MDKDLIIILDWKTDGMYSGVHIIVSPLLRLCITPTHSHMGILGNNNQLEENCYWVAHLIYCAKARGYWGTRDQVHSTLITYTNI